MNNPTETAGYTVKVAQPSAAVKSRNQSEVAKILRRKGKVRVRIAFRLYHPATGSLEESYRDFRESSITVTCHSAEAVEVLRSTVTEVVRTLGGAL